jgi:hypothetical protein
MKQRHLTMVAATAIVLSLVEAADFNAQQAIERMRAAQRANDYDMGGHAGRAIQLMREARYEMQAAAEAATR